ncbi:538_t:CDS:10 [Diversispora eburnea]|uniref:538_t:CDS:1 n=1 Tax=Diversispora eburnea TaxID=1213867 RepID=A0A9N9BZU5_9GLOM|nr:538_t:CDS:10 [Diversispora eburnea]
MTNFKIIRNIKTEFGGIEVTKLKSIKTGLSVVFINVEAPIVNGYFALATEAFDDYGCPHTLEHLVFLGSELYPYNGVLDVLANQSLAQSTNAWTSQDSTCYTIDTAGSQGFLNLLPIYVDHILFPTLIDSAHYTEVVYCEMQGIENSADARFENEYQHLLYPEGNGYRSDTGGKMECLRKLGVEKVRKYHSDYYKPDNLCLIVTGKLEMNELLKKLESLDERIALKGIPPSHKRPFVDSTPIPPLEKSIQKVVEFPDDDESIGQVMIIWLGPYIHEFVEIEDPLCTEQTRTTIIAKFENVPVEDLEELAEQVFKVFKRIVEEEKDGIDMDRMQNVIQRDRLKTIPFINVITGRNKSEGRKNVVQEYLDKDIPLKDLPYFIQYDLYLESFYGLPLNNKETGKQLSFEEVISELNKETISYDYSLGVGGGFGEIIRLEIKVEVRIQWLKDLLWNTEFTAERLKICATKLLNDIPQAKREGSNMSKTVSETIHYNPNSNKFALNVLNQERILPQVIKSLDTNPKLIINEFSKLREICDILKLNQPKTSWIDNFKVISNMPPLSPIPLAQHVLTESGRCPGNKSSFSIHVAKAPLMVLFELLQACEGLFYKTIRGQGLAYGVMLSISVESVAKKVGFGDGFEGAKSGVIHELVNQESNIQKAAKQSFILQALKNLDASFNRELISKVQKVKFEDLYSILIKYIVSLFLPETSNTVIISTPNNVESIQASFKSNGFDFKIKNLNDILN